MHANDAGATSELAEALADLEHAAGVVGAVLHWPAPPRDGRCGGSAAFDVYLLSPPEPRWYEVRTEPAANDWRPCAASAFGMLRPGLGSACLRKSVLAELYARAGIVGMDPALHPQLAASTAAYVATLAVPCGIAHLGAIDDAQAHPELSITNPVVDGAEAPPLFPWFVQHTLGVGASVDLLHALLVLSEQPATGPQACDTDEPDLLDTLDRLQKPRGRSLADLLLDYAVARAFAGQRDVGQHLPESRYLGSFGNVRFDWSVPYASLPRRLRHAFRIEPTGSAYLWVDLAGLTATAGLSVRVHWDTATTMRLSFLRVGADGWPVSRMDPATPERATELDIEVETLADAAGLLMVLCNVGPSNPSDAYDPDEPAPRATGYEVYLARHDSG